MQADEQDQGCECLWIGFQYFSCMRRFQAMMAFAGLRWGAQLGGGLALSRSLGDASGLARPQVVALGLANDWGAR
jgi:hypothetical protein